MKKQHEILLTIDGIVNLGLGILLLLVPFGMAEILGVPRSNLDFYPTILGGVIFGIGIALLIERYGHSRNIRGLGLGGAIVINDEALKQLQSLTKKTSGVLQEKLAEQGVAMLLGNIFKSKGSGASSSTIESASEETPEASAEEVSPEDTELGGEEQ